MVDGSRRGLVRGNDDQRNAEPVGVGIRAVVRWVERGLIVKPAAPVIPDYDDRRVVPVRRVADRVDDRRDPRRAGAVRRGVRMVRVRARRRDVGDVGERVVGDIVLPVGLGLDRRAACAGKGAGWWRTRRNADVLDEQRRSPVIGDAGERVVPFPRVPGGDLTSGS